MEDSAVTVARRLHRALESGRRGSELRGLFTEDATTLERPNLIKPRGAALGLDQMLAASLVGSALLSTQRYDVVDAFEVDELAVLRLTWTGTIATDAGPFSSGQELCAHVAQFVTVHEGRIRSIETYDCYEPFEGSRPSLP